MTTVLLVAKNAYLKISLKPRAVLEREGDVGDRCAVCH